MILSRAGAELVLDDHLQWVDEHAWTPVAAVDSRGITGKINRQTSLKVGGRPITLKTPEGHTLWGTVLLSQILTLRAWIDDPATVLVWTPKAGESYGCKFSYEQGSPLDAQPILDGASRRDPQERWRINRLSLITT